MSEKKKNLVRILVHYGNGRTCDDCGKVVHTFEKYAVTINEERGSYEYFCMDCFQPFPDYKELDNIINKVAIL